MAEGRLGSLNSLIQVASVVTGVVVSILSFNATRQKESEVRQIEAAKPFLDLRQNVYKETVKMAAILADPSFNTPDEMAVARKRFRQLYIAELSMVEANCVEQRMVDLAREIDPELATLTPAQAAAFELSHALRDSFARTFQAVRELGDCGPEN